MDNIMQISSSNSEPSRESEDFVSEDDSAPTTRQKPSMPRRIRAPSRTPQVGKYCHDQHDSFFTDIVSLPGVGVDIKDKCEFNRVKELYPSLDIYRTFGMDRNQERLRWKPQNFKGLSSVEIKDMEDLYLRLYGKPLLQKDILPKVFAWGWVLHRKLSVPVDWVSFSKVVLANQFRNADRGWSTIRQDWCNFAESELNLTEFRGVRYPPYTPGPLPGSALLPQAKTPALESLTVRGTSDTPSEGNSSRQNVSRRPGFPGTPAPRPLLPATSNPKVTKARAAAEEKEALVAGLIADLQKARLDKSVSKVAALEIALKGALDDFKDARQIITVAQAEAVLEAGSAWWQEEAGGVKGQGPVCREEVPFSPTGAPPCPPTQTHAGKGKRRTEELTEVSRSQLATAALRSREVSGWSPASSGDTQRKVGKQGTRRKLV